MKKILVVLIVMLTAGCGSMGGMRSSGHSSSMGGSGATMDNTYSPNYGSSYGSRSTVFPGLDSTFQPYYGD